MAVTISQHLEALGPQEGALTGIKGGRQLKGENQAARVGEDGKIAQKLEIDDHVHVYLGDLAENKLPVGVTYSEATQAEAMDVHQPGPVEATEPVGRVPTITVFWNTLWMALASGLGAVPFFFVTTMSKQLIGLSNAIACGVMIAASFDLLREGEPYGSMLVIVGIFIGMIFIKFSKEYLEQYDDVKFGRLKGAGARKTLLVVGVMAAHAIGEGSGVGVSYSGSRGWSRGVLVTLAIGLHNIPEGLAVATVMVSKGETVREALWWSTITSLPQTLAAVPSFLFVETFTMCLPLAMGFAAGSMIWVVFAELMPDALADVPASKVASATTISAACLEGLRMMLASLEQPGGTLQPLFFVDWHTAGPMFAGLVPVLVGVPLAVALAICKFLLGRPFVHGLLMGLQMGWGFIMVMKELFFGKETVGITMLYSLLGGTVTSGIWSWLNSHQDMEKVTGSPSSPDMVGQGLDTPPELPLSWPPYNQAMKPKVFAAIVLCLLSVGALGVVEGQRIARAVITNGGNISSVLLPAVLIGILFGAAVGFTTLLFHRSSQKYRIALASVLSSLLLTTAVFSILRQPLGRRDIPDPDPLDVVGKSSAAVGGALLYVSAVALWPVLKDTYPGGPKTGTGLGCLAVCTVYTGLQMMCSWTPYCLQ